MSATSTRKIIFLVGPTAVGKTEISLALASGFNYEIISADSMQVYKHINIGTAKATAKEQTLVPHHLLDICELSDVFSVYAYRQKAFDAIKTIESKGKMPLFVGGTGLYVRAITDGLAEEVVVDFSIRERIQERFEREGAEILFEELKRKDPVAANQLNVNNTRRLLRAHEIMCVTGEIPSIVRSRKKTLEDCGYEFLMIGLQCDRELLYDRVNKRVDLMMEKGLLEEARMLYEGEASATVKQAVGYKEFFPFFQGAASLETCVTLVKQNTRRLVKRQLTWFRSEERIHWFDREDPNVVNQIKEKIHLWKS